MKRAIWSVDKDQPIVRVATMDNVLANCAQRRFALIVFEAFALAALALAASAFTACCRAVSRSARGVGVRAALGRRLATSFELWWRGLDSPVGRVDRSRRRVRRAKRSSRSSSDHVARPDHVCRVVTLLVSSRRGVRCSGSPRRAGGSGDYAESGIANVALSRRARA